MTLLGTSLRTGVSTVVRMAVGLILNKLFAVYVGPAGLGQVAQLSTLAGIVNGIATGGVTAGVTRYVAEYGDARRSAPIVTTALAVVAIAACTASALLVAFSQAIAWQIFGSDQLAWAIWIIAGANIAIALSALGVAILNGRKRINALALLGVAGSVLSLAVGAWLIVNLGFSGAVVAACLAPALFALVVAAYLLAQRKSDPIALAARPDRQSLALLARYSAMTLTAAIVGPASVLLVRDHLATEISWEAAGYWQGVWKISEVYLTLITSSLAVYFLPRLAELREASDARRELHKGLLTAVPVVAAAALAIYLLRKWITVNLFSESFLPMAELFGFQLLGDILKIASWVIAYLMIARAMVLPYILTEVIFSASFVGLAIVLVRQFGLIGVTYAYCANYLAYLVAVAAIVKHRIR